RGTMSYATRSFRVPNVAHARLGANAVAHRFFFSAPRQPPRPTLFPYTTLFRSTGLKLSRAPFGTCSRNDGYSLTGPTKAVTRNRSEEHTSELQSRGHLVCRLLLENKNFEGAFRVGMCCGLLLCAFAILSSLACN